MQLFGVFFESIKWDNKTKYLGRDFQGTISLDL